MAAATPPHGQIWTTPGIPQQPALRGRARQSISAGWGAACCATIWPWRRVGGSAWSAPMRTSWLGALLGHAGPSRRCCSSRRHVGSLLELTVGERAALANLLRRITTRYDNCLPCPSLHDGHPPATHRWRHAPGVAPAPALLRRRSCARHRAQVHGGLRDAGQPPARPDARIRRGAAARAGGSAVRCWGTRLGPR